LRNALTILLNIVYKKELELLYGEGAVVEINNVQNCTNKKNFSIDCTLKITDINLFDESNVDGLKYLIEESWKFLGEDNSSLNLITTFDVIP
jgi:hypothetical protein